MDANIRKCINGKMQHLSIIDDEVFVDPFVHDLLQELKLVHTIIGLVAYPKEDGCIELVKLFVSK